MFVRVEAHAFQISVKYASDFLKVAIKRLVCIVEHSMTSGPFSRCSKVYTPVHLVKLVNVMTCHVHLSGRGGSLLDACVKTKRAHKSMCEMQNICVSSLLT